VSSSPASTRCPVTLSLAGPSPSIAERPSRSRSEKWMWQELPSRAFGLAMKVIDMPSWAAISFAPFL
jgi:hypothetical protein